MDDTARDLKEQADNRVESAGEYLEEAYEFLRAAATVGREAHSLDNAVGADAYARACTDYSLQVKVVMQKVKDFHAQHSGVPEEAE